MTACERDPGFRRYRYPRGRCQRGEVAESAGPDVSGWLRGSARGRIPRRPRERRQAAAPGASTSETKRWGPANARIKALQNVAHQSARKFARQIVPALANLLQRIWRFARHLVLLTKQIGRIFVEHFPWLSVSVPSRHDHKGARRASSLRIVSRERSNYHCAPQRRIGGIVGFVQDVIVRARDHLLHYRGCGVARPCKSASD